MRRTKFLFGREWGVDLSRGYSEKPPMIAGRSESGRCKLVGAREEADEGK